MIARLISGTGRFGLARPIAYGVVAQASAVALMALSGWLLSRAAEQPPVLYLLAAIVGVRALGLSRGVFRYLERLAGHDVALRVQARLRLRVYDRLAAGLPIRRSGDLLARLISDVDAVQDLVVRVLVPIASAAVLIIATGAAISAISWPAGLLVLAGGLVSGGLLPWVTARQTARSAASLAPLRARLADEVAEISRTRLDLAAYAAERDALDRLTAADADLAAAERRLAVITGLVTAMQWLCTGLVVAGSVIIGGRAVVAQTLEPAYLAVLALTPLAVHEVLAGLPAAAVAWHRTRSGLRRVTQLVSASLAGDLRKIDDTDDHDRPVLQTTDLAVGWPGGPVITEDLHLNLRRGERVAVVAPSGSGKSTLAATLVGLIPPRAGVVRVPARIGYLAQDAHTFDTTVAENLRIGARDATASQLRAALESVGLEFAPDRHVGEYGTTVSGGEARRLALARLAVSRIVHGPYDLLILDEPTEHLDRGTAAQVTELIWRQDPTAAILVLTHDRRLMAQCDRIVELPAPLFQTTAQFASAEPSP